MKRIVSYNFILPIIKKMNEVLNIYPHKEIIWFGCDKYVPIMNTYLLKYEKYISMVIDNDKKKWGKKVLNYYPINSKNNNEINSQIPEIFIKSPDTIKDISKNVVVFLASKFENEMVKQLKELGINEEFIYTFSTKEEECILKNSSIQKMLVGWKRLNLKEMQQRELKILKHFKKFCDANKLNYFLAWGTLLGAVRHNGFIPWDDDIDVYMPYDDYKKFLEIYKDNDKYYLCDWSKNDNYTLQFSKLMDCETLLFHGGFPIQMQLGVYIDIFPLVGFPDKQEEIEKRWNENIEYNNEWIKYYIARDIFGDVKDSRKEIFNKKYNEYSFSGSKMVSSMHTLNRDNIRAVKAEYFSDYVELLFENEYFKAPVGYKEYLTYCYGDYMQLPEKNNRMAHLFPSYVRE